MKPEDELDLDALFDEIYLEEGKAFSDAIKEVFLEQISKQGRRINHLQAKIDQLMLEYCPEEMTEEQIAEWGKHQRQRIDVNVIGRPAQNKINCANITSENLFKG